MNGRLRWEARTANSRGALSSPSRCGSISDGTAAARCPRSSATRSHIRPRAARWAARTGAIQSVPRPAQVRPFAFAGSRPESRLSRTMSLSRLSSTSLTMDDSLHILCRPRSGRRHTATGAHATRRAHLQHVGCALVDRRVPRKSAMCEWKVRILRGLAGLASAPGRLGIGSMRLAAIGTCGARQPGTDYATAETEGLTYGKKCTLKPGSAGTQT